MLILILLYNYNFKNKKKKSIDKILSEEPPLPPNKTLTITARIPSNFDKKNDDMEAIVVELTELIIRIIDFIGEHGKVDNDVCFLFLHLLFI